jgi:hypothetical protein
MRGEEAGLVPETLCFAQVCPAADPWARSVAPARRGRLYGAITVDAEGAENLAATASFPARLRMRRGDG